MASSLIKFGTYLILFTPLILGTDFFFPFVGPKSLYFMGIAEVIFFSWLFLIIYNSKFRPSFNPVLVSLILFLVILSIATILGADPSYSFWSKFERMTGILILLHLFTFFLVVSSSLEESDWSKIFAVSIFMGVLISFITLISFNNPSMHGGATIGNDSFLGTYLLFNLFLALYLFLNSKKEIKIFSLVSFLIMFLTLFLSGARAAKFSFLGGLGLLALLYLIFIPKKRFLNLLGKIFLLLAVLAFILITIQILEPGTFFNQEFIKLATKARFVVWQAGWKGFQERPWLGWGPENFEFVFLKYFNPCMFLGECGGEVWFDRAHNIIFDTLISGGILGLLTYAGIFIASFYILWRNYFQKKIDFWQAGIFSVLFISYSVQNLTVFDMVSSYMMFFLILGFIARKEEVDNYEIKQKNPLIPFLISILFLVSFSKFVLSPLKSDNYAILAMKADPFSEQRLSFYKKTLSASPVGKYQIREFFAEIALSPTQSQKSIEEKDIKQELEFLIQELEKSVKQSPLNFRSHLVLGQLYNEYSNFEPLKIQDAERVLEKAIELSPKNQQGYWYLAQTRLYQGRFQDGLSLAEIALNLEPRLEKSHLIVVQIAKKIGDNQLAEEKIKEAIKIDPSWESDLRGI